MRWTSLYSSWNILWHCPSLGLEWKLTFSSPVATAVFSKFAGILSASCFRLWNSSAINPSPPLALFIVMLPKVHLTSHSRMSSCRWVTTPSWLSRSSGPLYSSSLYSCQLFLISSASYGSVLFLSFIVPILAWNVPFISLIFLKRSLVFPLLLFSSISLHCLCKKAFLSLVTIL